jgi:hypothetical protein
LKPSKSSSKKWKLTKEVYQIIQIF